MIMARSMHNCRVFTYYGGVQKATAVLKGALFMLDLDMTPVRFYTENISQQATTILDTCYGYM